MQKTQLNAFKSLFLIRISNNLLIHKIDQINQISILSFYFSTFLRKNFRTIFFALPSAVYFRIIYLSPAASAGDLPLIKVPNFPLWHITMYFVLRPVRVRMHVALLFYIPYCEIDLPKMPFINCAFSCCACAFVAAHLIH